MHFPSNNGVIDLKKEYALLNQGLCAQLGKCIVLGLSGIIFIEVIEALIGFRVFPAIGAAIMVACTLIAVKRMWHSKENYEKGITIFCLIFYFAAIFVNSLDNTYFTNPYESFIFGYSVSISERQMVGVMSNLNNRTSFTLFALTMRLIFLPRMNIMIYIKHIFPVLLSICLDMYKEQRNHKFFDAYIQSREQLAKFKDLVSHHIPEGIAVISQDLTSHLFVNDFFVNIVPVNTKGIGKQLDQFLVQQDLEKSPTLSKTALSPSKMPKRTLLSALKSNFYGENKTFEPYSCIVSTTKFLPKSQADPSSEEGTLAIFEVKAFGIVWDNQPAIAVILHDITEHHTILSLKIADAQKDKVLATVSHELKTPLNGMLGMIQIMEKKISDMELLRFLTICKSSTNLLVSLVSSILDLNQIRANKIKLNFESVDIRELLQSIVSLFEYQCHQKGIYLRTRIDHGVPYFLMTDKERLSQVLINLVGNAHKFTTRGGITLSVSETEERKGVRFSVEDTGVGISNENKKKLFQVFGRVGNQRMNRQGVGLGLTIAETLVQALNDSRKDSREISVESEPERGSKFSFIIKDSSLIKPRKLESFSLKELDSIILPTVPNDEEDLSYKLQSYSSKTLGGIQSPRKRPDMNKSGSLQDDLLLESRYVSFPTENAPAILIVDDNLFNIAVAEHLVLSHRYRVRTALSGQEAIDIIIRNNFKRDPIILILMDCQMPVMDGYETTRRLKTMMRNKTIPVIPIVALTANDTEGDKKECKEAGMCDHLSKPLKDKELLMILKKYC